MKIEIENVGPIKNASIKLNKLNIIAGKNNTGKTLVAYTIYSIFNNIVISDKLSNFNLLIKSILNRKKVTLDLKEIRKIRKSTIEESYNGLVDTFPSTFNFEMEFFKETKISLETDEINDEIIKELILNNIIKTAGLNITFDDSDFITICLFENNIKDDNQVILALRWFINSLYLSSNFLVPFVITSERVGISLFYKELDYFRNSMMDELTKKDRNIDPFTLMMKSFSRYPRPIKNNIDIIRDLDVIKKSGSIFSKESEIVQTFNLYFNVKYKYKADGIFFSFKDNRKIKTLPSYIGSTSIRALLMFDVYLNYMADGNNLLIIDEPELNLHPDYQRKIARIIAMIANSGITVIVTTHSDYILRELNNLIMLSSIGSNNFELLKDHKILQSQILNPNDVSLYYAKDKKLVNQVVDEYGFSVESIDSEIENMNNLTEKLFFLIEKKNDR